GGLDGGGLDLNRDARAADDHEDVQVAGVHTTVLGELGRLRVDDALLDLAEDVRVVTVVDRDAEEAGGLGASPDLGEARVLDGDGVLVDVETISGVVPQVVFDEVAGGLRVVRQVGLPQVVVRSGNDQARVARVRRRPGGVDRADDRPVLDGDELGRIDRRLP